MERERSKGMWNQRRDEMKAGERQEERDERRKRPESPNMNNIEKVRI